MRKSFLLHPRITLIYWVSQIIGWGVFTFINILALISMNQATQPQIAYITLLGRISRCLPEVYYEGSDY